ncbi:hypothetical protein [Thalassotalea litorea]|uniref:hypothetical protein n=1 Tax=Thalassotalea litorea TaxID=2020715 RepID=UPI0037358680
MTAALSLGGSSVTDITGQIMSENRNREGSLEAPTRHPIDWHQGEPVTVGVEHVSYPNVDEHLADHVRNSLQEDFGPPALPH